MWKVFDKKVSKQKSIVDVLFVVISHTMNVLFLFGLILGSTVTYATSDELRLTDLEPSEAEQRINSQDQTLRYAPKVDSNVPALRYIGNEQHQVAEDIYLANQYHGQDGLGAYVYGYSVPDIAKTEKKNRGGDLKGAYNYINGDGQEIKVEYWDDGTGFHQVDNVPKIQPKQIEDLPEVKAAKEEHLRIWQEQAERNSHPIADPYANTQYNQPQPTSLDAQYHQYQGQPGQYQGQAQYSPQQAQQPANPHQPQYAGAPQQPQYAGAPQQPQYNPAAGASAGFLQSQSGGGAHGQYVGALATASSQGQAHQDGAYGVVQGQVNPNSIDYAGQYSENRPAYAQGSNAAAPRREDEDTTGPPKGFFYNFDYPVGIIVSKTGQGPVAKQGGGGEVGRY